MAMGSDGWPGGVMRVLFTIMSALCFTAANRTDDFWLMLACNFIAIGMLAFGVFKLVNYRESYNRHFDADGNRRKYYQ
jgi:hypothetical protein